MRPGLAIGGSLLAGCAACAGCAARLPHPPYSAQPTSALVELILPIPPARVERLPARPSSLAVWIDGEWTWRRARWAWMPGRWVVPPAGETYSPWVVVRGSDGRLWHAPGVWRDANGKAIAVPPTPVAVASVDSGQVVNASGSIEPTGRTLKSPSGKPSR